MLCRYNELNIRELQLFSRDFQAMQWKKNWDQLGLLMWKNLCLQKKLWKTSLFLIVYPLYFVVLLVIVRSRLQFVSRPAAVCHSFTVSSLSSRLVDPAGGNQWHLAYTPNTSLTNRILKQAAGLINMVTEAGVLLQIIF